MIEHFYKDNSITVYNKSCTDMPEIPNETVQCVVTSPPYWGLRKYAGEQDLLWDNHNGCVHEWGDAILHPNSKSGKNGMSLGQGTMDAQDSVRFDGKLGQYCQKCSAWSGSFGLEPTPELYVRHSVKILQEIKRVLRKDGVVFWNIDDSYMSGGGASRHFGYTDPKYPNGRAVDYLEPSANKHSIIKPKDLCLIPFRLAIAAQEDGWYVRSVIIWNKPNPMPESVKDRPTGGHEYILLLTKSSDYFWDIEAVKEPAKYQERWGTHDKIYNSEQRESLDGSYESRNIRDVWDFPTQGYREAHFATFPEELPTRCIKAGTPEYGCCDKCGTPYERIIIKETNDRNRPDGFGAGELKNGCCGTTTTTTTGWQHVCNCENSKPTPSIVLDPFSGSGTTLWVSKKLARKAIGYELSSEYCKLILDRNRQMALL